MDKLISYFLNKSYIRSRKYSNSLLIKSIIKYLKLLTLNNLKGEILYNNKIKESCFNNLFINYFSKDFINVFHYLTSNTTKPATPKTYQKLKKTAP